MDQGQGPVAEEYPGDQAEESGDENPLWEKGQAVSYIAIRTERGELFKVRRRLRRAGFNAYLPVIITRRRVPKGDRVKHVRHFESMMRWVLVEAPESSPVFDLWLHSVTSTKGVVSYLKSGDQAGRVSQNDVDVLKDGVAKIRFQIAAARHRSRVGLGSKSAIKTGSLAGKVGTIQWIRGKKAGLEARLFGSMRVVEVDVENLEAA